MQIYWYAPFNNASELELARCVGRTGDELCFQSLETRRGVRLAVEDADLQVIRDLPDTAGDNGTPRTRRRRAQIALQRVTRRHRLVQRGDFDIVHLHTYNPYLDPIALRRLPDPGRLVVSVHNVRPHDRALPKAAERALLRAGYRVPRLLIVAHQHLQEQLVADFGIDPSRISVIPLPIAPCDDQPPPRPTARRFLLFGTLRMNKGIQVALDAIRALPRDDVELHLAGRGHPHLEAVVEEAARADRRITAEIGYVPPDRQDELFRSADVILLPYTEFSAQSGVLRDAYAYRRPVIASDVGALGREVRELGTGLVVAPGSVTDLVEAMDRLVIDEDIYRRLTQATAAIIDTRSFQRVATAIRDLYDEL